MKLIALVLFMAPLTTMAQDASGFWQGAIQIQGQSLRIVVDLGHSEGSWQGTIDIPLQGLKSFALSDIKTEGDSIEFKMSGIPGEPQFNGKLVDGAKRIEGDFQQNGATFKFELARGNKAAYLAKNQKEAIKPIAGTGAPGTWAGDLKTGQADLRLIFEIKEESGHLTTVLNSVDQGVEIQASQVELKENQVTIEISRIQAEFEGKLNQDGSAFEGTWHQGGMQLPLTVYRVK